MYTLVIEDKVTKDVIESKGLDMRAVIILMNDYVDFNYAKVKQLPVHGNEKLKIEAVDEDECFEFGLNKVVITVKEEA